MKFKLQWNYVFGSIVLIIALFMYKNDITVKREKAEAVTIIRHFASQPIKNIALCLDMDGVASNLFVTCSDDAATNITSALSQVVPGRFPAGKFDGDHYMMWLMFTNNTQAIIEAIRLYDDPSNLYVRTKIPTKNNKKDKTIKWKDSRRVLVPSLGHDIKEAADQTTPKLREGLEKAKEALKK